MKRKQITAAAMAVLMTAAFPGAAYAEAGPSGIDTTQSGIAYGGPGVGTTDEEAAYAAALEDNKMEYGELGDLIVNYNVDYKNTHSKIVNSTQDLDTARGLREEASSLMLDAGELRSDGMTDETRELYNSYKETAKELRKEAQKITNTELKSSSQRSLRKIKVQLTVTAQQMMIGYHKAASQQELVNKKAELAGAMLESTERQAGLGMKSQEEVLTARQSLKQAENGAAQFDAQLLSIKQNLRILTGWSYDAEPEISPIPASDLTVIDTMNTQNDLQDALGANYELYDLRSASAGGASSAKSVKKRNVSQMEQDIASTLESLYATVISKKQAYEGAVTAFEAADQLKQAADRKNSMGMMGRLEYLSAEVDYLTAKSAKETADLDLFSAMETYSWAVKGLIVKGGGGN